jgi:reductive dehalogenase
MIIWFYSERQRLDHTQIIKLLLALATLGIFTILLVTARISHREGEPIATKRALLGALTVPLPYLALYLLQFPGRDLIALIFIAIPLLSLAILIMPWPVRTRSATPEPRHRIDERDTMFSRNEIKPGSPEFAAYYQARPDALKRDELFRAKPGLMSPDAQFYHPLFFTAAEVSFTTIDALQQKVEPVVSRQVTALDPAETAGFIKSWIKKSGAHSIGITRLKPEHLYSVGGRGNRYGKDVVCDQQTAIAFSVEMNKNMVACGPGAPTVLESADQYLLAAVLAVKLAAFLARLGYKSRAHIDANYLVVCPLVARDAGLGEIGRMGLLMTPKLGPRVRLAVVTTELDLPPDAWKEDRSMTEFCRTCQKCADVCPSQAIPRDDMTADQDGLVRWQIDQERCFSYWCQTGTDCGRCIALCPYAHPDNPMHNTVRFLIRHAPVFRRFAAVFDDWLYGSKPAPHADCGWKISKKGEMR